MIATWDWRLVVLSYFVAALASYTALDLADRVIKTSRPASRRAWLASGALVMGIGIWAMHFTGMLAFQTSAAVSYDVGLSALSALVAVAAAGVALFAVSRPTLSAGKLLAGGVAMGVGIASMHYVGMAAMRMAAELSYYPPLVALSFAIAVGASVAALWLAGRFSREGREGALLAKGFSGLLLGAAIVGMHYTGMAAARFSAGGGPQEGGAVVGSATLGGAVGSATLVVLGVALACSMVDRRFAAQAAELAETERLYDSLFEQSVDQLLIHDPGGRILEANSEACRALGYSREELLSLRISEIATNLLSAQERQAAEPTLWQRAMETEPGRIAGVHEGEHVRKDGSTFPVEVRVGSVDYRGERAIFAAARDVTARKAAEESYHAVVETAPDAIITMSSGGVIRSFNAGAERIFGYVANEAIGQPLARLMPERFREAHERGLQRYLRTGEARVIGGTVELAGLRKDGGEFPVELSLAETRETQERMFVGVIRDVTERKRADEEIRRLNEELEERVERRTAELTESLSRHERSVARERALRGASAALVAAPDRESVYAAALEAVLPFIDEAAGTRVSIWSGSAGEDVCVGASGDRAAEIEGKQTLIREFPDWLRQPLTEGRAVEIAPEEAAGFRHAFRFETKLGTLFMVPLFVRGCFEGRIVVASDSGLSGEIRHVLEALGSQVALALERADLIEELHRRRGEERFRALIQNSSDVIFILEGDADVSYVSPTVQRVFGHNVAAGGILAFVHPEDAERMRGFLGDLIRGPRGVLSTELRLQHADGSWLNIELRGDNLLDDPAVGGLVINARDITERKRDREELATTASRLSSLIENMPSGVLVEDESRNIRHANAAITEMFEIEATPEELSSDDCDTSARDVMSLLADPEGFVERIEQILACGRAVTGEEIPLADGRVYERDYVPVFVEGEYRGHMWHYRDLTERRRAEQRSRDSERRLRAVMSGAPVILFSLDTEGVFTIAEGRSMESLKLVPADLVGRSVFEVYADSPEVLGYVRRALDGEDLAATVEVEGLYFDARYSPLRDGGGEVSGVIGVATEVTERRELERALEHRAFHDSLTDLPNRALFDERLRRALARSRDGEGALAVLFLDLDNFKLVNDSLNHDAGDALLVEVAGRVRSCMRETDTAARLGGDEFTVLVEGISGRSGAVMVAERIAEALGKPFYVAGQELSVTFSVGIALSFEGEEEPADLLRDADVAMYQAKRGGRARYEIFDRSMSKGVLERLQLEADLRRGVEGGEILVYYQPKVSVESGEIRSVEALARWEHPDRGFIPPDEFIPIAEQTGLIRSVSWSVLTQACRQVKRWQESQGRGASLSVSVNISAKQLQSPGLVGDVRRALRESGLAPSDLTLELTESVMVEDAEVNARALNGLRQAGVRLAVDDFGKGYSSLTYLKRLSVDMLKIDRAFIEGLPENIDDTAIVRAIITFARTLGLPVVAEGVETAGQLASLRWMGCDLAQGYYLARPMPPGELEEVLRDGRALADPRSERTPTDLERFADVHRSAERSRTISRAIADSRDCVVISDPNQPDCPMVYVNRSFERLTGYTAEEAIGYNCRFLQRNDTGQPELDGLRAALAAGEEWTGIVRNYRKDGTIFYNELSISPVYDDTGRLVSYLGVQNDVTDRAEQSVHEPRTRRLPPANRYE